MTVAVTGGAGYIGSHTVLAFLDKGERPLVIDNLSTGHKSLVPEGVDLHVGDVGNEEFVGDILKRNAVDSVVHFAASIVVPDSVADPLGYYYNNTVNTRALLSACVKAGVKHFVFSSTAAVYGNPAQQPVTEQTPLAPLSPYGASKMMSERMIEDAAAAFGFTYAILRYFNVAGADPALRAGQMTPRATHLIKVAVEAALGKRDGVDVFGTDFDTKDGTGVRDYIHVSDLAAYHVAALDFLKKGGKSGIFNCGYGKGASVREVIASVERAGNCTIKVQDKPPRPGDPAAIVANPALVQASFAVKPRFADLDTITAHALAFEKTL